MAIATMRVPTVFTAIDRFSDVVSKMSRKTAAFGETAQAAAMRTSRKFNDAGTSMIATGAGIAFGLGLAVNEAVKFEKSMSNVSTTIDSTPEMMKQMSDSVLEMATKVPVPISQLTDALYDVVSAGIEANYSMMVLKSSAKLGVAGLGTAKEGVDIITSSLNAFNIKATESERIANMVFKAVKYGKTTVSGLSESFGSSAALVKNSNVSLEEYLATTAVLTTTGMTASRAQTQVSSAVTALIKPSGTMSKIFARIGVKDVPLWIKSNGGLVKSMRIVRDQADKMGILTSKAFGRKEGFSAMLSLLGPLAEKYKLVMGDIMSGTDSMTEAVAKQQKTFSAQFQIMKNKVISLGIAIGNEVMPRITGFMNSLSPIITSVIEWTKNNEWLVTSLLSIATGLLILGGLAKTFAVLFYGVGAAIEAYSAIMAVHRFVVLWATMTNVGYAASLWAVATATMAAYWPILLFVGALGLLAYAFSDTGDATKSMVSTQVSALDKGNEAWRKSTQIQAQELAKQKALMKTPKLPVSKERTKMESILIAEEKRRNLTNAFKQNNLPPINESIAKKLFEARQMEAVLGKDKATTLRNQGFTFQEFQKVYPNTAGYENRAGLDKKGEIKITIKGNSDEVSSIEAFGDYVFSGIGVHTSSTKK